MERSSSIPAAAPAEPEREVADPAADRLARLALRSARIGSWEWDLRSGRVQCSELVESILGVLPGTLAQSFEGFVRGIHPADRDSVLRHIDASLHGSSDLFELEHRVVWADGSVHWIESKGLIYRDAASQPVRVVGAIMDVTRRKEAEERLVASEAVMRQLITHTPAAVAMFDREMRYLQASERWLSDYHLLGQEIVGRSHYEIFPDIPERWKEVHRRVLAGAIERCDEDAFLRATGDMEWLQWEVRPWRQANGEVGGLIMFTQVITDRKRAALALIKAEEKFSSVFLAAPVAISISRVSDGLLVDVNRQFERLFGHSREQAIGRTTVQLGMWPNPEERSNYRFGPDGAPTVVEFTLRDKSGALLPLSNSAHRLELDGQTYVLSAFTDLRERKRAESDRRALERQLQHAQRMEAVGRLAAGIAHDFNNVLAAIKMSSELLREGLEPGHPALEDVFEIRKAADRAVRLTRQLLAFSRQQVLEPRVLDLNELVANLEKMLQRLVGDSVELVTKLCLGLGAVKADPSQLEQVIVNLAVNARDAMPDGGTLSIETSNVTLQADHVADDAALAAGDYVALSVADTGIGMDAQTKARMFEPFFTTKELGKGTGLGLSTVYGIVRQSGGAIDVVSELAQGTGVRILLPRVNEAAESIRALAPLEPRGGTETVLVVEDDAAVRLLTRRLLARLGYRVLDAPHPAAARELADVYVGAIDVLLTDLVMPGGSGRELAEKLQAQRPALRVLYMSGYTDDLTVRQGMMGPASAYLQKPFSSAELAEKLRGVLDATRS